MEQTVTPIRTVLTVTELARGIKRCLDDFFPDVWVKGEIKGLMVSRGGHWYFDIKDSRSLLRCVMFAGRARRMEWKPASGEEVFLKGSLVLQNTKGEIQLSVKEIEPLGLGIHQRKVEALKRQLKKEGLLDPARKRPLPQLPRAIGIATSAAGAVLHDIQRGIFERFPGVTLYLAPCKVEGRGAAEDIAAALRLLNDHGLSEVIIVGRGGGSRQALAAFDEEIVARTIAGSRIPVVSAVGHETDHSIADLVADRRAETPSKAAVLVVPVQAELQYRLNRAADYLRRRADQQVRRQQTHLEHQHRLLRDPTGQIALGRQQVVALDGSLRGAMVRDLMARQQLIAVAQSRLRHPSARIAEGRHRGAALRARLSEAMLRDLMGREQLLRILNEQLRSPQPQVDAERVRVAAASQALTAAMQRLLESRRERLAATTQQLDALSPLAVLSRGYSLTLKGDHAVRDAAELTPGDSVEIRLAKGRATATITAVEAD
ncbi:MAG: exodeoxyribonuclease VII large subunit [Myxococcota bacterium]